jgi:hypothetical protein
MVANLLPSKAFPENSGGRLAESTSRGAAVTLQRQALLGCLDFIGINIYITKIGIYIYIYMFLSNKNGINKLLGGLSLLGFNSEKWCYNMGSNGDKGYKIPSFEMRGTFPAFAKHHLGIARMA